MAAFWLASLPTKKEFGNTRTLTHLTVDSFRDEFNFIAFIHRVVAPFSIVALVR